MSLAEPPPGGMGAFASFMRWSESSASVRFGALVDGAIICS